MRAFEWETKGVSRTLNPSAAAARAWPFSGTDGLLHTDTGTPKENQPSNVTEKGREADRPADSSDGAPV